MNAVWSLRLAHSLIVLTLSMSLADFISRVRAEAALLGRAA